MNVYKTQSFGIISQARASRLYADKGTKPFRFNGEVYTV